MAWILTAESVANIDHIAAEGAKQFGFAQSEVYELQLVDMFDMLAANPYMAVERYTAAGSIRLMPVGAHNILYVVDAEDVIILRVLHGLQNWFEQL
ncbi:type II toxin-antitoxin system RelE/ParE family toxin [Devosia sp. A8/3-2]|nr:type II toxin-antitoxin system RelE/ParE family toxin [Devosia sp. A8/3-2]